MLIPSARDRKGPSTGNDNVNSQLKDTAMTEAFKNDDAIKQRFRASVSQKALTLGEHVALEKRAKENSVPLAIAGLITATTANLPNPLERQLQLIDAIHIGADLSMVPRQLAEWLISNPSHGLLSKVSSDQVYTLNSMIQELKSTVKPDVVSESGKARLVTFWKECSELAFTRSEEYKASDSGTHNAWLSVKHIADVGLSLTLGDNYKDVHWATVMNSVSEAISRAHNAYHYAQRAEFMKRTYVQRLNGENDFKSRMNKAQQDARAAAVEQLRRLLVGCKSPIQALLEDTPPVAVEPEAEDVRLKRVLGQLSQATALVKNGSERTKLVDQALVAANDFVAIADRAGAANTLRIALDQLQVTETAFGKSDDRTSFIKQSESTGSFFGQLEEFPSAAKAFKLALLGIYATGKDKLEAGMHDRVTNKLRAVGATLKLQQKAAALPTNTESAHTVEGSE